MPQVTSQLVALVQSTPWLQLLVAQSTRQGMPAGHTGLQSAALQAMTQTPIWHLPLATLHAVSSHSTGATPPLPEVPAVAAAAERANTSHAQAAACAGSSAARARSAAIPAAARVAPSRDRGGAG